MNDEKLVEENEAEAAIINAEAAIINEEVSTEDTEQVLASDSDAEVKLGKKKTRALEESKQKEEEEVLFDPDFKGEPITVRSLLTAGAHFGHKTERWNPKMVKHIYGEKNGVHIINLDDTLGHWLKARKYIVDLVSRGGSVLFVGTKLQARQLVKQAAKSCDSSYVNNRWLGGALSNFQTMKKSLRKLKNLEDLLEKAQDETSDVRIAKKERLEISRQVEKLESNLGGIKKMRTLPDVLFVVDIKKESIAVAEAKKLHIPVVALVDTNVDPDKVNVGIPANDDAYKTLKLFLDGVAEAIAEGKKVFKTRMQEQSKLHAKASSVNTKGQNKNGKREVEVNTAANQV